MTRLRQTPELPHVYELVAREAVDSVLNEARRLARAGAGEGTLVWAQEQTDAHDIFGRVQAAPRGNLHACLILQPEHPPAIAAQLACVAVQSLGLALADLVPPMTELRYGWPDAVRLNGATVGRVALEFIPGGAEDRETLLLAVTVNVPRGESGTGTTSLEDEGVDGVAAAAVLEGFARYFFSQINRWAEAGWAPVRKAWMQRMEGLGEIREIRLGGKTLAGRIVEIDGHGALILESPDGARHALALADYFGRPAERQGLA